MSTILVSLKSVMSCTVHVCVLIVVRASMIGRVIYGGQKNEVILRLCFNCVTAGSEDNTSCEGARVDARTQ